MSIMGTVHGNHADNNGTDAVLYFIDGERGHSLDGVKPNLLLPFSPLTKPDPTVH